MVSYKDVANNTHTVWYRDPGMRKGMIHIVLLYFTVYSLGYDGSLLNGLQALPSWAADMGNPVGLQLGLIAASYYLPKIPVAPFFAWMCDRWGRRCVLWIGVVWMIAGAVVGGFSYSVGQFIGARIMLGVGTNAASIGCIALIPELAHPRMRHYAGSFLLTTFYIGSILSAWITFGMVYLPGGGSWAWRVPTLFQGVGPVVLGVGLLFVPESPRWLVSKGREEEALKILATYHANGQLDDELVILEMAEIKAQIEMSKRDKETSFSAFLKSSANRRRLWVLILVGLCTQLSGNGVVQYYLVPILRTVGITAPPQTAGINGGLAIFNWFVAMAGASLVERFGRRPLFLFSLAGQLFCFVMLTGLAGGYASTKITAMGVSIVPFIFLQQGFYSSALTPLPLLYVPEILPNELRAKGIALYGMSQNIAQTFNQFVNPIALAAIAWKYYAVYVGVLILFLLGFYLSIRETRGLTVEEAAVIYEDEDKKQEMLEAERRINAETTAAVDAQLNHVERVTSKGEEERIEKV